MPVMWLVAQQQCLLVHVAVYLPLRRALLFVERHCVVWMVAKASACRMFPSEHVEQPALNYEYATRKRFVSNCRRVLFAIQARDRNFHHKPKLNLETKKKISLE